MGGVCGTAQPADVQQRDMQPRPTANQAPARQQPASSNADEAARRTQRAKAAELRARQQANRGRSSLDGGRSRGTGMTDENSLLYPNLSPQQGASANGDSRREKTEWEIANADGIGAHVFQTRS